MSVEKYISSLAGGGQAEMGEFTLSASRARELLAECALSDYWDAWLCLLQGFYSLQAEAIDIDIQRQSASFTVGLAKSYSLQQLAANSRFLLGWLNLSHFGEVGWNQHEGKLSVEFNGSVFQRYFMARSLGKLLQSKLSYAVCPTTLNGRRLDKDSFPKAKSYTIFHSASTGAWGLNCASVLGLPPEHRREIWLGEEPAGTESRIASLACKTNSSWSEVCWLSHGVVISDERNTLERPGMYVLASVEELNLKTDLSGFSVVHDQAYFHFINRLKKEVLWML